MNVTKISGQFNKNDLSLFEAMTSQAALALESAQFIERMQILQQKILVDYSVMLKKGGMLVYSTCSVLPSENEKQVEKFIQDQKGAYELSEQKIILPSEGFDGFFMARLRKIM